MLDRRKYEEAIFIYDGLIPVVAKYEGNDEFKITYETSLNNRGVAKCKLALKIKDARLYEKGLADFPLSVEASGITDKQKLQGLIAWRKLQYSENKKHEFDTADGKGLSANNKG